MELNIVELINTYGFPIIACIGLGYFYLLCLDLGY